MLSEPDSHGISSSLFKVVVQAHQSCLKKYINTGFKFTCRNYTCTISPTRIGRGAISRHNLVDVWIGSTWAAKQKNSAVCTVLLSVFAFIVNLITIATLGITQTTSHIFRTLCSRSRNMAECGCFRVVPVRRFSTFRSSTSFIYVSVYLKGTWSWSTCEQLMADKCGHSAGSLVTDSRPAKPQQTVVWSRFAAEKWEPSILSLARCASGSEKPLDALWCVQVGRVSCWRRVFSPSSCVLCGLCPRSPAAAPRRSSASGPSGG